LWDKERFPPVPFPRKPLRGKIIKAMKDKKTIRILIAALFCVLLVFFGVRFIQNMINRNRLLKAVHLENTAGLRQIDYVNWTDLMQYKDGYEIMAFSVDDPQWDIPDEWTIETPALLIDELGKSLDIRLDEKAIIGLSLGGVDCSAWFFVDGREKEKPAGQREYHLGYLYDHYNNPLIFIYRGHHLYGME